MYRHCLDLWRADCSFDLTQRVEGELVDLIQLVWILPVVLYHVYIVGGCEKASEGRRSAVPERCRDDAYSQSH